MSEDLIRHWMKKARTQLECEKPDRKHFEKHVRDVERKLKAKKGLIYPEDPDS